MRVGKVRPFDWFIAAALVVAVIAVLLPGAAKPRPAGAFDVSVHRNITYYNGKDADARKHRLDVYEPRGKVEGPIPETGTPLVSGKGAPVLVYVHGGAWKMGSKMLRANVGETFAGEGIVTVLINYRLSPRVKHPAHIRDVACAFDWVRKNIARYGGDPDDVFLSGHSAGGHLVALLALNEKYLAELGRSPDEIRGVIPISGLYRVGATGNFAGVFDPDPEALKDASPLFHVKDRQTPFLVVYAEHDLPLLDIQAISLEDELKTHGTPVTLLRVPDRDHVNITHCIGDAGDPTTEAMLQFIRKHSRAVKEQERGTR